MKKGVKVFGFGSIAILIISIIIDLQVFRGYFIIPNLYSQTFEEFNGDIEYSIENKPDGTLDLRLKNNSLSYVPIILYRSTVLFDFNDTILFNYAGRHKFWNEGGVIFDSGGGFDCGTDLTAAYIKPFETFVLKNQRLENIISTDELAYFIISNKEKGIDISSKESLTCQLYLPIFSLGNEKTRVYSNKFKIPTEHALEAYKSYIEK